MSTDIQIVPLSRNSRDVLRFLKVSYGIYRDDPHWVAPLLMDLKKVFTDANPLFEHAVMQLWVATRGGQDVGRIAGIIDRNHNHAAKEPAAFFGFFESVDDPVVSRRLFETVFAWTRQAGLQRLLGPMNPTTNDECGLLVEGFDSPPVIMMTYNPRYYVTLVEAAGFRKAKDLLAFHMDLAKIPMDRLGRIAAKIKQRNPNLVFRAVRRKTLQQDLVKVKEVYNAAWEDNWGFVPMTDAEVDFMAARLKPLLMEGLIWLAEAGTEPVGFLLALPDYNIAAQAVAGAVADAEAAGVHSLPARLEVPAADPGHHPRREGRVSRQRAGVRDADRGAQGRHRGRRHGVRSVLDSGGQRHDVPHARGHRRPRLQDLPPLREAGLVRHFAP